MAANPGRIFDVVDVDLPYPRTEQVRLTPTEWKLQEILVQNPGNLVSQRQPKAAPTWSPSRQATLRCSLVGNAT